MPDNDEHAAPAVLLLRAADADTDTDTAESYLYWRWLPEHAVGAHRPDPAGLRSVLHRLRDATPTADPRPDTPGDPGPGAAAGRDVRWALTRGALIDPAAELALARDLARLLIPPDGPLRERLLSLAGAGQPLQIRVSPTAATALIPWEILSLGSTHPARPAVPIRGDLRLVDLARIVLEPPTTVPTSRRRRPPRWADTRTLPVAYVTDPPAAGFGRVLDDDGPATRKWAAQLTRRQRAGRAPRSEIRGPGTSVDRVELSRRLRDTPRSRLFYLGHVSNPAGDLGSAALHLADPDTMYGLAPAAGRHRPLTALDLFIGTLTRGEHGPALEHRAAPRPLDYPDPGTRSGAEIWPMPSRVALIACASGADHASPEPFGLAVAATVAGAEWVTGTRWALPTDAAFRDHTATPAAPPPGATGGPPPIETPTPTIDLAIAVDNAHEHTAPDLALWRWQRTELDRWRDHGHPQHSPLYWASLVTHWTTPDSGTPAASE